jgi:16S rRNA (cytidine1402-2'-O)-methyltransferase
MPSNLDGEKEAKGKLFVVSTPIGNLADITLRALDTLRSVDLVAAEDTRRTRKLLSYYDIHKPLISYHEHNARERGSELLEAINSGRSVALVTDAGTPGISDPGKLLIEEALHRGMEPVAIPGPTALISALSVSGLQTRPFIFLGFPPARGALRKRFFEEHACLTMTLILYESPKRLERTLEEMLKVWGDRRAAIARELTKMHEEIFRGTVSEAVAHFKTEVRGELTLVVDGAGAGSVGGRRDGPQSEESSLCHRDPAAWKDELKALLDGGSSSREAASVVAARFNLARRTVYQAALAIRKQNGC